MEDAAPRTVPADPYTHQSALQFHDEETKENVYRFREAVGSLMYAMLCTRPDIAYALNQVA